MTCTYDLPDLKSMRKTYFFRQNEQGDWYSIEAEKAPSKGTGTVIIEDTMAPTWHPADGKYYDSKSKFRQVTKAHGCVEVGNDYKTSDGGFRGLTEKRQAPSVRESIARAARGELPRERN